MSLRADVDTKFIRRFLIISIGSFFLMLWGGYDASYGGPSQIVAAKEYKKLHHLLEKGEITEDERATRWGEIRDENGWPSKPDSEENARNYIRFNWFLFGVGLIAGIFFLIKYMNLVGSWMEAKDDGIETSWGQSLKFDQIQEINKRRWKKKGIAVLTYNNEVKAAKTMVLDDFKYHRENVGEILKLAEKDLDDNQIVFGTREDSPAETETETEGVIEVAD